MQVKGDWLPVHADAQHLPFLDDSFDATISFGVQAYLDDPAQGMSEMVRVTRPGGLIGLWYAPRRSGVSGALFAAARGIVPRLPGWVQRRVADMMVPFLGLMPTASSLSLRTGSWRECREVILVNIAPKHIAFPTAHEIISELTRLGCEMVAKEGAIEGECWARKKPR
jgi:ubiquinone/menaquinone biosynthesis C-methylase UbiE